MKACPSDLVILKGTAGDAARSRAAEAILNLSKDSAWTVSFKQKKPRRSDQQNRYLWGVVYRIICEHLEGFDAEDVHEWALGECFGWETLEAFGRKRLRPIRRSSKLNKQEFADYIAWIQRTMAAKGVVIPDPDGADVPW